MFGNCPSQNPWKRVWDVCQTYLALSGPLFSTTPWLRSHKWSWVCIQLQPSSKYEPWKISQTPLSCVDLLPSMCSMDWCFHESHTAMPYLCHPLPRRPFTAELNLHVFQGAPPMPTSWRHCLWSVFSCVCHTTKLWFLFGVSRQPPPKRNSSCSQTRERAKSEWAPLTTKSVLQYHPTAQLQGTLGTS